MTDPKYTLLQLQRVFSKKIATLILWAYDHGYEITLDWAYRPPEVARMYAAKGIGSRYSNHILRLAMDLNLFKNGTYLQQSEDHLALGEFWESLAEPGVKTRWGGRFKKGGTSRGPDGNHYSIEFDGRA